MHPCMVPQLPCEADYTSVYLAEISLEGQSSKAEN